MKGKDQTMIDTLPLSKKDTKASGLDEARQATVKVGREVPKLANETFWRVVIATNSLGDTLVELQHSEWNLFMKRKSNTLRSIVQLSAHLGFTLA